MDDENTLAVLASILSGTMQTLAGLTSLIQDNPELADQFAKGLMLRDADYVGEKPAISLAVLGAALYIHRLACEELSVRELEELDEALENAAKDKLAPLVMIVPRDPQLH